MKMTVKTAVALALASSAATTWAANLPAVDSDTTDGWANVGGATSTDGLMFQTMIDQTVGLCQDPTASGISIEVFTTEATLTPVDSNGPTNWAVACHSTNAGVVAGNPSGDVVLRKYSGSSGSGLSNVSVASVLASSSSADRHWVDAIGCKAGGGGVAVAKGAGFGGNNWAYTLYTSCKDTDNTTQPPATVVKAGRIPRAGLSDEEPSAFVSVTGGITQAQLAGLSPNPGVAVGWGPVVTDTLYVALQKMQEIDTSGGGCNTSYTASAAPYTFTTGPDTHLVATAGTLTSATITGTQTASCLPNLSRSILAGLFTGNITSTSQLYANPNPETGAAPTMRSFLGEGTDQDIVICRRATNSGTQVAFQTYFLRQNCGTAGYSKPTRSFVLTDGATNSGANWDGVNHLSDRVFAGTGTTDVLGCLNYHATHGHFAIGISSTEYAPNFAGGDHWEFVKFDGIAPNLENIVAGASDFFSEDSLNYPAAGNPLAGSQAIIAGMYTNLTTTSLLKAALVTQSFGTGGALQIPAAAPTGVPNSYPAQTAGIAGSPVNTQTKATSYGGLGNICNQSLLGGPAMPPKDASDR